MVQKIILNGFISRSVIPEDLGSIYSILLILLNLIVNLMTEWCLFFTVKKMLMKTIRDGLEVVMILLIIWIISLLAKYSVKELLMTNYPIWLLKKMVVRRNHNSFILWVLNLVSKMTVMMFTLRCATLTLILSVWTS